VIRIAQEDVGAERLEIAVRDALDAPCVPTGMNAGVSTSPCAVTSGRAGRRRCASHGNRSVCPPKTDYNLIRGLNQHKGTEGRGDADEKRVDSAVTSIER